MRSTSGDGRIVVYLKALNHDEEEEDEEEDEDDDEAPKQFGLYDEHNGILAASASHCPTASARLVCEMYAPLFNSITQAGGELRAFVPGGHRFEGV